MTSSIDVLVVGAGPAGVSAAIAAAARGARVLLIEQRPHAGGAIHRAAHGGGPSAVPMPARHKKNWARLQRELHQRAANIDVWTSSVFLGIDGEGVCMIDSREAGRVRLVRPRAVIFATGATERVPHMPGWELPGVITAGGLQVQLKESGQAPPGRILVAGNGPLPLALGAQLAALGNAPVAVLEAAPLWRNLRARPAAALGLAAGPAQLLEGAGYLRRLRAAGAPYLTGVTVESASLDGETLRVRTRGPLGQPRDYEVDMLVIHAGLARNDRGIPAGDLHGIAIARAGDCNWLLGADAALHEGRRAAAQIMDKLQGRARPPTQRSSRRAAIFQSAIGHVFAPAYQAATGHPSTPASPSTTGHPSTPASPSTTGHMSTPASPSTTGHPSTPASQAVPHDMLAPAPSGQDDAMICRCEGITRRALADQALPSPRETRLVGRIGMGLCQGRFCAYAATTGGPGEAVALTLADIDGPIPRWPIRPVSVKALAQAQELE